MSDGFGGRVAGGGGGAGTCIEAGMDEWAIENEPMDGRMGEQMNKRMDDGMLEQTTPHCG